VCQSTVSMGTSLTHYMNKFTFFIPPILSSFILFIFLFFLSPSFLLQKTSMKRGKNFLILVYFCHLFIGVPFLSLGSLAFFHRYSLLFLSPCCFSSFFSLLSFCDSRYLSRHSPCNLFSLLFSRGFCCIFHHCSQCLPSLLLFTLVITLFTHHSQCLLSLHYFSLFSFNDCKVC